MKRTISLLAVLAAFITLVIGSQEASEGAQNGLSVCAATLIPSLLPFFTLSNLLVALGLSQALEKAFGKPMAKLFGVSGAGASAFFIGLSGGYPLGASVTADLRREGRVTRQEAEHLLCFCNNSGPAFIVGAAGAVFASPLAGILLYGVHIVAAVCVGVLLRPAGGASVSTSLSQPIKLTPSLAEAFPDALRRAVTSTLSVCAYVTFFSALLGLINGLSALPAVLRVLLTGFLELGGGIAALSGCAPSPVTLAVAAGILGFGGLSVHCQTLSAVAGTDIKCARHLAGRALDGVLSAVFAYLLGLIFFS